MIPEDLNVQSTNYSTSTTIGGSQFILFLPLFNFLVDLDYTIVPIRYKVKRYFKIF